MPRRFLQVLFAISFCAAFNLQPAESAEPAKEHRESKNDFVQPDYTRWTLVSEGMSEREVVTLLGEPLARTEQTLEYQRYSEQFHREETNLLPYVWNFGHLRYDSAVFPEPFEFRVIFVGGKVQLNTDPFEGRLSGDGTPTTPELILPQDDAVFTHNPRWLDMRWTPSAGIYPIDYQIDIDTGLIDTELSLNASEESAPRKGWQRYTSSAPQLTIAYRGGWPARWRVRAVNKLGYSDWSEFRTFVFTER